MLLLVATVVVYGLRRVMARRPGGRNDGKARTRMEQGFYWLIEGALAGCGRPGLRRGEDALDADLAWLQRQGIDALLSLTEQPLPVDALERHGLSALHLPVPDMTPPTAAQLRTALAFIDRQRAAGRTVAVHCRMGQGRTGTVLAAYLIRGGLSAEAALRELRAVCPHAVESPSQERALHEFAALREWLI